VEGHLRVSIRPEGGPPFSEAFTGPVELGRLDPYRAIPERLLVPTTAEGIVRIPVAEPGESDVSRRQARLDPLDDGHVRLTNLSNAVAIRCLGRPDVPPGQSMEMLLPLAFQIGRCALSVEIEGGEGTVVQPEAELLSLPLPPPAAVPAAAETTTPERLLTLAPRDAAEIVTWWRQLVTALVRASSPADLFDESARAVVDLLGLDLGAVFLVEGNQWRPAKVVTRDRCRARPVTAVLDSVAGERRTFWNKIDPHLDVPSGATVYDAYVAAPILAGDGAVVGAVYGHREGRPSDTNLGEIMEIEALVVEALACSVAAALGRFEDPAARQA
jgi:adenylate cyclase